MPKGGNRSEAIDPCRSGPSPHHRRTLDEAGLPDARIVTSGGLDEYAMADLVAAGAPSLDSAYKLIAYDGRPVMKLLPAKAPYRAPNRSSALAIPATTSPGRQRGQLCAGCPLASVP
jgi:nicotinic acid phosphoribosyltransferase